MAYKWKPGYRSKCSAQVAGEVCADLEKKGELTAENLVDVSRPEDAPLHDAFDWNDQIAAEKWRKEQAGNIIRSIVIVSDSEDSASQEPVRAFFSIIPVEPQYESIHAIIRDQDKYADLLKLAMHELQAFYRKYQQLKELAPVRDAIISLATDLGSEGKEVMQDARK